jgi:hypothetical protein
MYEKGAGFNIQVFPYLSHEQRGAGFKT